LKGGLALKTCVLPMSFSVNQTCWPSGVAAMSGQKGDACATRPTCRWVLVSMTTVSGEKLEHTYPYSPPGEKIVMPGPFGTGILSFGS
jgi:hypothetical protein